MESPVRKMQKRNDYNRHKLLRKIKRRRKAAAEQQAHAAEKALKKKLRVTPPKYRFGKNPELSENDKQVARAAEQAGRVAAPHRRGTSAPNAAQIAQFKKETAAIKEARVQEYLQKKEAEAKKADNLFGGFRRAQQQMDEMANVPITSEQYNQAVQDQENDKRSQFQEQKHLYGLALKSIGTVADAGVIGAFLKARRIASELSRVTDRIAQLERYRMPNFELDQLRKRVANLTMQNRNYNILQGIAGSTGAIANTGQLFTGDGDIIDAIGSVGGVLSILGATDWLRRVPKIGRYADDIMDWGGVGMQSIDLTKTGLEATGVNMDKVFPRIGFDKGKNPIHIKPENRGKFTALKERTGHSTSWFLQNGTPAQKKMANFARNAAKWNH